MKIDVHVYFNQDQEIENGKKLDKLLDLFQTLIEKENIMSEQLDTLTREVAEAAEVQQSAILLIQGLSAQIVAMKDDPIALQGLADQLDATSNALAAAVAANTPAA